MAVVYLVFTAPSKDSPQFARDGVEFVKLGIVEEEEQGREWRDEQTRILTYRAPVVHNPYSVVKTCCVKKINKRKKKTKKKKIKIVPIYVQQLFHSANSGRASRRFHTLATRVSKMFAQVQQSAASASCICRRVALGGLAVRRAILPGPLSRARKQQQGCSRVLVLFLHHPAQLYDTDARDAHYGAAADAHAMNVAQYLLDLDNAGTPESSFFCGGMMFGLVMSDALRTTWPM